MKIKDILDIVSIDVDAHCQQKNEAIDYLIELLDKNDVFINKEEYKNAIYERENISTTGVGHGIAVPHALTQGVKKTSIAAMVVKEGLDYESIDHQPTFLFFMIAMPQKNEKEYLDILAKLSQMIMNEEFKEQLIQSKTNQDFLTLIEQQENQFIENKKEKTIQVKYPQLLAVTACPTGIAHTYMGAEALEKAAQEMNVTIKVETNGSGGIQNQLSEEEIKACEAIIVAVDKEVDVKRFEGKKVVQARINQAIHEPDILIHQALDNEIPFENKKEKTSWFFQIYGYLMNGVNHVLPFMIGSGVLLSLASLCANMTMQFNLLGIQMNLPDFFQTVGKIAFDLILPVLSGYIAMSIAQQPALFVGFLAGALLVTQENYSFLAACILGFVAGYVMKIIEKICSYIPHVLDGIKPMFIYPFVGSIIISFVTLFVVNPVLTSIDQAIIQTVMSMDMIMKLCVGIILGTMMSFDNGGPINKIAYVIGLMMLMLGCDDIMAAVMIAGMVPPIAIGLAMYLFNDCFVKSDKKSVLYNIVMGLCFVSEAAIPYIQEDRKHVLPACVIASSIASGLVMVFECGVRIPHGGIFVIGFINQPMRFIIALLLGVLVGMIIIGLMKKPIK